MANQELTDDEAAVLLGIALGGVVDVSPTWPAKFMLGGRDVRPIVLRLHELQLIWWDNVKRDGGTYAEVRLTRAGDYP
jgi:hypothetical protein